MTLEFYDKAKGGGGDCGNVSTNICFRTMNAVVVRMSIVPSSVQATLLQTGTCIGWGAYSPSGVPGTSFETLFDELLVEYLYVGEI